MRKRQNGNSNMTFRGKPTSSLLASVMIVMIGWRRGGGVINFTGQMVDMSMPIFKQNVKKKNIKTVLFSGQMHQEHSFFSLDSIFAVFHSFR